MTMVHLPLSTAEAVSLRDLLRCARPTEGHFWNILQTLETLCASSITLGLKGDWGGQKISVIKKLRELDTSLMLKKGLEMATLMEKKGLALPSSTAHKLMETFPTLFFIKEVHGGLEDKDEWDGVGIKLGEG